MRKKKKPKKISTKVGSLSFLFSIVLMFLVGGLALISWVSLAQLQGFRADVWSLFAFGAIGAGAIICGSSESKFRTFIHELKHSVPLVLTGGKIKEFKVGEGKGHVEYQLYKRDLHMVPIIALAPYCWPLLSLPVFICALLFEEAYRFPFCAGIGAALAIDLITGYEEIHPHQTDFKQIFGGFLVAGSFVAGAFFCWTNVCLLWVVGGRDGFAHSGYILSQVVKNAAQQALTK
jgi:hypothetical protein